MVVCPSPDILHASCPFGCRELLASHGECATFDLRVGLGFDAATNNFFVRNDREVTGDSMELLVLQRGQTLPLSGNALEHVIIFAPSKRGLLLVRAVIDDDPHLSALESLQRQDSCETLRADPEAKPARAR